MYSKEYAQRHFCRYENNPLLERLVQLLTSLSLVCGSESIELGQSRDVIPRQPHFYFLDNNAHSSHTTY